MSEFDINEIKKVDPEIFDCIEADLKTSVIILSSIASENFVSKAVMLAMGTPLTN